MEHILEDGINGSVPVYKPDILAASHFFKYIVIHLLNLF